MDLTNEQAAARRAIYAWGREGVSPFFVLFGYAGTGKTTLIKHLVAEARGYVPVLALTNKAVQVLREKGVGTAQTIHSYLYPRVGQRRCTCGTEEEPRPEFHNKDCPATKPVFEMDPLAEEIEHASLIIVDEASMVPEKLALDLLSKGIPVLAVGDPFQLPPVEGKAFWDKPNFQLTQIQRQAADNPIIQLAHNVRNGRGIQPGNYGDTIVTRQSLLQAKPDMEDWDQVLVYRHKTRCLYTRIYRQANGWTEPDPTPGELIMMRSNHKELGVANGDMFTIETVRSAPGGAVLDMKLKGLDQLVHVWRLGFGDADDWSKLTRMDSSIVRRHGRANYGYVITTHSAQGSEWPRVLIAKDKARDPKWLYTALTRARERAYVCLGSD